MLCAKKATLATSRRPSSRFCCCGVSSSSSSKKSSRATTRGGDDDERDAMRHHHHRLVFYRHSLCPYAHRVQLCLDELDALRKTRVVDVDLSKTPEWYLEKTRGRGMVPTMEFFFDDDPDDKEEEGFTSRKSEKKELVGESLEINRRLWDQFEGTPQTTDDVERFTRKCDDTFIRAGLRAIGGGWSFTRERNEKALERLEEEIWQLDALIESHAVVSSRATTNARNDTISLRRRPSVSGGSGDIPVRRTVRVSSEILPRVHSRPRGIHHEEKRQKPLGRPSTPDSIPELARDHATLAVGARRARKRRRRVVTVLGQDDAVGLFRLRNRR